MTMRKTPYERIRYPWASDVVSAADVQSMGADIDQALVQTANLGAAFSKMSCAVAKRTAAQSISASTVTAISFDATPPLDNGSDSPFANANWFNSSVPTRLTAPVPCVVLALGNVGINFTAAVGSVNALQCMITINGSNSVPNVQGSKYSAPSTQSGQQYASATSMWNLAKGDYLELKTFWRGTPAGPLLTDTVNPPVLSIIMVALPTVA